MIEVRKNLSFSKMIERLAKTLEKDTVDLFAIAPIQKDWKESILANMEKLIASRLDELRKAQFDNSAATLCASHAS